VIGLKVSIDRESNTPLFKQLTEQLRTAVLRKDIPEGTRLPSERELAKLLKLNRSVVIKAYSELKLDGLLDSRTGSGTYVASAAPPKREFDMISWSEQLSSWASTSSGVTRWATLLKGMPDDCIRLDTGVPMVGVDQTGLLKRILDGLSPGDIDQALNYPSLRGNPELLKYLSIRLNSSGIRVSARNILITIGTEEAIYLLFSALAKPGETVIIENPTYLNAINIARMFQHRVLPVDRYSEGFDMATLENTLQRSTAKFIYTMSCSHNPTGANMPERKKEMLVRLAEKYSVPIIDDTVFSEIQYDSPTPRTLKFYDKHNCVIEIGGISKSYAPGLRIGWIIADEALIERLIEPMRMISLGVPNLSQLIAARLLATGEYDSYLGRYLSICREKREKTKSACYRHLPGYVKVNEAQGGNFFWLELPESFDCWKIAQESIGEGVAVSPGSLFTFDSSGKKYLRLNPLGIEQERIEEGIIRLATAVKRIASTPRSAEGSFSILV
jgi:DNA-binding transcriptional MocR family regulator